MLEHAPFNHLEYYRYLNCGYRLPLVGGTDKMTSDVPVGIYRTYTHIPESEEFNYDNWCKNVSRGRTFLSGGPIIHLSVDGHPIGDTLQLSGERHGGGRGVDGKHLSHSHARNRSRWARCGINGG